MQKIDINKQYRTRDGREVKLFTTEARNTHWPVRGEVLHERGEWIQLSWRMNGRNTTNTSDDGFDLIEVVPRWSGKLWVHPTKDPVVLSRVACCASDLISEGFRQIDAQEVLPND